MIWAEKNSIVRAVEAGNFGPDRAITWQEMDALISNYVKFKEFTLPTKNQAIQFLDDNSIAVCAKKEVVQMQQAGIMTGVGSGTFDP